MSNIDDSAKAKFQGMLPLAGFNLPCYVLDDGTRVISQRGMLEALGMSRGGGGKTGGDRLAGFVGGKSLKPYANKNLLAGIRSPRNFIPPHGGRPAYAYEATILADLCEMVLAARGAGALLTQQEHIADNCEALLRGFARVGIVALIDEVTGYQDYRTKEALLEMLERFIQEELRPYTKTFPDDFYKEMFRLKDWPYDAWSVKRPSVVGKYTNDFVYARLAPGVLEKLQELNPVTDDGVRDHYHHQHMTENEGYPKLKEHLSKVVTLMKASSNWRMFKRLANRALPRLDANLELLLDDDWEDDD